MFCFCFVFVFACPKPNCGLYNVFVDVPFVNCKLFHDEQKLSAIFFLCFVMGVDLFSVFLFSTCKLYISTVHGRQSSLWFA